MQKLSQLLKVFHQKDLTAEQARQQRAFRFLEPYLPNIFPSAEATQQWINTVEYAENRPEYVYRAEFLPFHTRDNRWLAKYTAQIVKPANANIKLADVKNFVAHANAFDHARNQYELDLVKAQIQYLMEPEHTPNGLMMLSPHEVLNKRPQPKKDACENFRAKIIRAMRILGLDPHNIEVGLETNANLWRKQTMEQAFVNYYENFSKFRQNELDQRIADRRTSWKELMRQEQQYRAIWVKLREYRYYFDHQPIIDELGTATDNMKMSTDEAFQLNMEAVQWHKRYQEFTKPLSRATDLTAEPTR